MLFLKSPFLEPIDKKQTGNGKITRRVHLFSQNRSIIVRKYKISNIIYEQMFVWTLFVIKKYAEFSHHIQITGENKPPNNIVIPISIILVLQPG